MRPRGYPFLTWRDRLATIAITALLTSVFWLVLKPGLSGVVFEQAPADHDKAAPVAVRPETSVGQPRAGDTRIAATGKADGRLVIPVRGVAVGALVDTFTQARASGMRSHDAIDILAPRGSPVLAAAPGTVEKLFLSKAGGVTVYIRSDNGRFMHYYAHLDRYAPGLAEGQHVDAGQPIGEVGSTGNADPSAPHLHYAIMALSPGESWWQGIAINPYPLLTGKTENAPLPSEPPQLPSALP